MAESGFLTGVIEGFFGRPWPFAARRHYATFLARMGLNSYLYCPKGDPHLRARWYEDWPAEDRRALADLCTVYRDAGLNWGVGLSPMALYRDYGPGKRQELLARIDQLEQLGLNLLAILFDDMPGAQPDLAARQAEIVNEVAAHVPHLTLLMCPTYYSHDPGLEKHFGERPEGYWVDLGQSLDPRVHVFWTGNEVCAASITRHDLEGITGQLGRAATLWDNYPVNDSARRCRHLYTSPLSDREGGWEHTLLRGHFCNPMNQPLLSLPALNGLAQLYFGVGLGEEELALLLGPRTAHCLARDASRFEREGLDGIDAGHKTALIETYRALDEPAAREVADWLAGEYAFDPACLTQ